MRDVFCEIGDIGVVPVVVISDADKAVPLAQALVAGGIPCIEVTFRTSESTEAMRRIAKDVPEIILGAGTTLSCEQVDRAIELGAQFIVSPGFNPYVVDYCLKKDIPVVPGCGTPSDMEMAIAVGLEVVKFFPAEQWGGLSYIKAVSAPYDNLHFIPTGGINASNLNKYLSFEKVLACGGSWIVKPDMIADGRFDEITLACRRTVKSILEPELRRVELRRDSNKDIVRAAETLGVLLGAEFAADIEDVVARPGDSRGKITVGVKDMRRARAYLDRNGILFSPNDSEPNNNGETALIYLKEETVGFTVCIAQK
jgi:2-dehydro-3-deoxyphosphogluconate aldolase/(4S)-4-hydroxy-2-oxoglutarate aldolase